MRMLLEQRVLEFIRQSRMIAAGDRVSVAVSAGADSIALFRLLEALRDELGITLLAVHFDHMLRDKESDADARFVAELARASGVEYFSGREDVRAEAERTGANLEDAARRLRYAFFERALREKRATRIAVAHTADDQAETVLGHVMRGTGLTGLAGIYPVVELAGGGEFVRPLLSARRQELRDYLQSRGQIWREDATNRDETRLRARIRARLLPFLERDFSPAIVEHLGELARFAREEESFWGALVEDRLKSCCEVLELAGFGKSLKVLASDLLAPLPFMKDVASVQNAGKRPSGTSRALTERLVRRLYESVRGDRRELSARHVEQVIHLAANSTSGKRVSLPGRIEVERVFDHLIFSTAASAPRSSTARETKGEPSTYQYVVSSLDRSETMLAVPELATRFCLKMVDWPLPESDTKSQSSVLDAAALHLPLILRNWRPGDAFRALGHGRARKLKQMFLADRIPVSQRARWPVLESDGQVVWARGMAAAEDFRAREHTKVGVVIEEVSP
jgi:tRNA(Ile)-lysidine synthase